MSREVRPRDARQHARRAASRERRVGTGARQSRRENIVHDATRERPSLGTRVGTRVGTRLGTRLGVGVVARRVLFVLFGKTSRAHRHAVSTAAAQLAERCSSTLTSPSRVVAALKIASATMGRSRRMLGFSVAIRLATSDAHVAPSSSRSKTVAVAVAGG